MDKRYPTHVIYAIPQQSMDKRYPTMSSMCLVWHLWWTSFPFQIFHNSLTPKKGPHKTGEKTTYKLGGDLIFSHGLVPRFERHLLLVMVHAHQILILFRFITLSYDDTIDIFQTFLVHYSNIFSSSAIWCWIIILFFKIHFSSKNDEFMKFWQQI
jgi:hypothetical protein